MIIHNNKYIQTSWMKEMYSYMLLAFRNPQSTQVITKATRIINMKQDTIITSEF